MWWEYIIIVAVLIFGIYSFLVVVGFRTRLQTRKTDRTAESMYRSYADSNRKQRKHPGDRGGQWRDDDDGKTR